MWGAIIGDLAGSIYEYEQTKEIAEIKDKKSLITDRSFYSDDTILTIAILEAVLDDCNYERYLKEYGLKFINYKPDFEPYFKTSFSPGFINWLNGKSTGTSIGNGALMRISSIGFLFNSEEEVIKHTKLATIPSHNSTEAISSATLVARIIYLAKEGYNKEKIMDILKIKLSPVVFSKFNSTCIETINNCLYAVFSSNNYEDSILKILSFGGDTDTNACIVGSMAEALYGIDKSLIEQAKMKIPPDFVEKLELGYKLKNQQNSNHI